jgi:hypothetical protein
MRAMTAAVVALGCLMAGAARAEAVDAKAPIVSVGLFKNGLAVVRRVVETDGPGIYRLSEVPTAVHGTFWIESDGPVTARVSRQEFVVGDVPAGGNLQDDLAGCTVSVRLRGEDEAIKGEVVRVSRPEADAAGPGPFMLDPYGRRNYYSAAPAPTAGGPDGRFLVLKADGGLVYVRPGDITRLELLSNPAPVKQQRPVLLLDVPEEADGAKVVISYLAYGLAWAPSYRVDITDPERLAIGQKAVLRNELEDLTDVEVSLISGFPSVEFLNVSSPLTPGTSWESFFRQLSVRQDEAGMQNVLSNVMAQQAVSAPEWSSLGSVGAAALAAGEGPDLHYQSVGGISLAKGDALSLAVADADGPYKRIVEWLVPDDRQWNGRRPERYRGDDEPPNMSDAWDALLFANPFKFPMTTAPAMVVGGGRFFGQRTTFYTSPGREATLRITKALNVTTRSVENEAGDTREYVVVGGRRFQRTMVQGELRVRDLRAEPIDLVIRRRFSGELLQADGDPKCDLLEEGVYSVNQRNELLWRFDLAAGEEKVLKYSYKVLVWMP